MKRAVAHVVRRLHARRFVNHRYRTMLTRTDESSTAFKE